jgi:hypothetical protein
VNVHTGAHPVRIRGDCSSGDAAVYITFLIFTAMSVLFQNDAISMAADSTVNDDLVKKEAAPHNHAVARGWGKVCSPYFRLMLIPQLGNDVVHGIVSHWYLVFDELDMRQSEETH